jgi:hypothetical protein
MCCLRYEHDFYVASRKRFPKEGKIIVTAKGEEKVLAIDIFREQLTLRSSEGESRTISLADFNTELSAAGGRIAPADSAAVVEDENTFEISPELNYTIEHEIPSAREHIVLEPSGEPVATGNGENGNSEAATRAGDRDDTGAKRRRGRRGGRRGRGSGEQGER